MIARCVRERRRVQRYRLPTSSLKKLESRKFGKNEIYDTCAICLDDYEEGDRLRILPCRHGELTVLRVFWLLNEPLIISKSSLPHEMHRRLADEESTRVPGLQAQSVHDWRAKKNSSKTLS